MRCGLIVALLFSMPCWSQSTQPKNAETSGFCSPAVTGSNNQFTITCQGVSKEEISTLLRQNQGNVRATLAKIQECTQEIRNVGKRQEDLFDEEAHRYEEIKEIVEGLNLIPGKLLEKYRLGYVIFDLDYRDDVFPYQSNTFLEKYQLDWTGVGIENEKCIPPGILVNTPPCEPNRIVLRLPGIGLGNGRGAVINGVTVDGAKRVGQFGGTVVVNELKIDSEILAIRRDGIIFLVGFNRYQEPISPSAHY